MPWFLRSSAMELAGRGPILADHLSSGDATNLAAGRKIKPLYHPIKKASGNLITSACGIHRGHRDNRHIPPLISLAYRHALRGARADHQFTVPSPHFERLRQVISLIQRL